MVGYRLRIAPTRSGGQVGEGAIAGPEDAAEAAAEAASGAGPSGPGPAGAQPLHRARHPARQGCRATQGNAIQGIGGGLASAMSVPRYVAS